MTLSELREKRSRPGNTVQIPTQSGVFTGFFKTHLTALICTVVICILLCAGGNILRTHDNNQEEHLDELLEVHGLVEATARPFWNDIFCLKDFEQESLRKAMPRLAVAMLFWLTGMYFNNLSQAWLQKNMDGYYVDPKSSTGESMMLWDAGHSYFPTIATSWVTVWTTVLPALAFARFMIIPGPLSMRWTVLNRMLLMWGLLWGLRAITIISTALPNPDKMCKAVVSYDNIFMEAFANLPFMFWTSEMTCHDVMFSGHTVVLTLSSMILIHYSDWAPWLLQAPEWPQRSSSGTKSGMFMLKAALMVNLVLGYYFIAISRTHYTADVLVAAMLTVLVFQVYHAAVAVAFLPQSRPALLSAAICPCLPLLRWFEKDAADVTVLRISLLRKGGDKS